MLRVTLIKYRYLHVCYQRLLCELVYSLTLQKPAGVFFVSISALDDRPTYNRQLRTKVTRGFGTQWRYVYGTPTERRRSSTVYSDAPAQHHYVLHHQRHRPHHAQLQQQQTHRQTGGLLDNFFCEAQISTILQPS